MQNDNTLADIYSPHYRSPMMTKKQGSITTATRLGIAHLMDDATCIHVVSGAAIKAIDELLAEIWKNCEAPGTLHEKREERGQDTLVSWSISGAQWGHDGVPSTLSGGPSECWVIGKMMSALAQSLLPRDGRYRLGTAGGQRRLARHQAIAVAAAKTIRIAASPLYADALGNQTFCAEKISCSINNNSGSVSWYPLPQMGYYGIVSVPAILARTKEDVRTLLSARQAARAEDWARKQAGK